MTKTIEQTEHFKKYDALYKAKGSPHFTVPATPDEIKDALAAGDEHLNTIPLKKWDACTYNVGWTSKDAAGKSYKSLSDQVCLLKHYARYYYIN
jgi:hypothetical protein